MPVIDHVGFEVADLERSAAFYDAVFGALGGRRLHEGAHAIAYGTASRSCGSSSAAARPAPGYGHVALRARGRAAVVGAHAPRSPTAVATTARPGCAPQYGPLYYAAYVRDPDGLRVEFVSGSR